MKFEGHFIAHKADYYRLLLDTTRTGNLEPWAIFMLLADDRNAFTPYA